MDLIDNVVDGDTYSDAKTIPYTEPFRDTSKQDEIYRRKAKKIAIKILNKKRKLKAVAESSDEEDNPSNTEIFPMQNYTEAHLLKKTKYIGKSQREKL